MNLSRRRLFLPLADSANPMMVAERRAMHPAARASADRRAVAHSMATARAGLVLFEQRKSYLEQEGQRLYEQKREYLAQQNLPENERRPLNLLNRRNLSRRTFLAASAATVVTTAAVADTPFTSFAFPGTSRPTNRTMPARIADIFNVKDYGALGDFSNNDATAIQAALDAAGGNGIVFFPPGGYKVNSSINIGVSATNTSGRIIGSGRWNTSIFGDLPNGFVCYQLDNTNGPEELSSVTLQNQSTWIGSGALMMSNSSAFIHGCHFRGMINVLLPFNIYDAIIQNCTGEPNLDVTTGYASTLGIAGYAPHIYGWRSTNNFQTCFQLWGSNGCSLIGNGIENCEVAILLGMKAGWASQCTCVGTTLTIGGVIGSAETNFGADMQIFGRGLTPKPWPSDPNDTSGTTIVVQLSGTPGGAGTYQLSTSQTISTPVPMWSRFEANIGGVTLSSLQNEGCHYGLYANSIGTSHITGAGGNSAVGEATNAFGATGWAPHSGLYIRKASGSVISAFFGSNNCHGGSIYFDPVQPVNNLTMISVTGSRGIDNSVTAKIGGTLLTVTALSAGNGIAIGLAVTGAGVSASTAINGGKASEPPTKTFTVTIASPAVFTRNSHGLSAGDQIQLTTLDGNAALPTGALAGTTYFVIATGLTANNFELSLTSGGAAINTSGTQSGTLYFAHADGTDGLTGYNNIGTYRVNNSQTVASEAMTIAYGPDWVFPTTTEARAGLLNINPGTSSPSNTALGTDIPVYNSLPGEAGASTGMPRFEGQEYSITDSNTATWGAIAAGGGSNHVKLRYNGTNWTVMGK